MNKYLSYPEGYNKLVKDMLPWYLKPFNGMIKGMFMKLLLQILTDG